MKRILTSMFFFYLFLLLVSCDLFTTPLFTTSRDTGGAAASMSTKDIALSIGLVSASPEQTASLLDELAGRDATELEPLPLDCKEAILSAAVSVVLPMSEVTNSIQSVLNDENSENIDFDSLVDAVVSSGIQVDTKAVEVLLSDTETLANADAYTLMMSAASLIVSVFNNETAANEDRSATDFLNDLKEASGKAQVGTKEYTTSSMENALEGLFCDESIETLLVVMDVVSVLGGTAKDKPNRSGDMEDVSVLGFDMGSFLHDFLALNSSDSGSSGDADGTGDGGETGDSGDGSDDGTSSSSDGDDGSGEVQS